MGEKSIFALSAALMVLFFLMSNFERQFFVVHCLQASFYLILLLLLYYGLEEWAYVMAFVTPIPWIVVPLWSAASSGSLAGLVSPPQTWSAADIVGLGIFLGSIALLVTSGWTYKKDIWGRPGALKTALGAIVIVGVFYAVLIGVTWRIAEPRG